MEHPYCTVEEALEELYSGRIIISIDDPDRENEGDMICAAQFATTENVNFMAVHAKGLICTPMSGEVADRLGAGLPDHMPIVAAAVVLEGLDGYHLQSPLLRLFQQLDGAHHSAVIPHDLTAQAALGQSGQAAQIHRGLGVAVPNQHPAPPGHQRKYVAGTAQILRTGGGIGTFAAGVGSLLC